MFGVATSEHPIAAHAVAECAGVLLDQHASGFESVLCIVSTGFEGATEDITRALRELLGAECVSGVVSRGVLMGSRLGWDSPAMAVLAGSASEMTISDAETRDDDFDPPKGRRRSAGVQSSNSAVVRVDTPGASASIVLPQTPRGTGRVLVELHPADHYTDERRNSLIVTPLDGAAMFGPEVVVTAVEAGQLVAIDELPAAEFFESLIISSAEGALDGATEIGFTTDEDGQFVAARASPLGLATSVPVLLGSRLVPAARGPRTVLSQLAERVDECVGGTVLAMVDEGVLSRLSPARPTGIDLHGAIALAGAAVSGITYDDRSGRGLRSTGAVVISLSPSPLC